MQQRGVYVDHSTAHRWALQILPVRALIFRHRTRPVGTRWRMDETYNKVTGPWKYLCRAVDKSGDTVFLLLTAKRGFAAARRHLERAVNLHGLPEKITTDTSGANTAASRSINADACLGLELRQSKHVSNVVGQDHRPVKRITNPMLGFKLFGSAHRLVAGMETMHMVKAGQLRCPKGQTMSKADRLYSLAF